MSVDALVGSYDYQVVALSVLISVLASYGALDLGARVTTARGWARRSWLIGGAAAMGIGIWSMHYTGMLSFHLPVAVRYDWPTALLSLLTAILASVVALFVVSRERMGSRRALVGSIFMGAGIVGLHSVAMASMRLPATSRYSPALVALSVAWALGFSFVSLRLTFLFREERGGQRLRKVASALLMGAAISFMHYTGMAAASFTHSAALSDVAHAVSVSSLGIAAIGIVTLMVLEILVLTSLVDRLEKQKALLGGGSPTTAGHHRRREIRTAIAGPSRYARAC